MGKVEQGEEGSEPCLPPTVGCAQRKQLVQRLKCRLVRGVLAVTGKPGQLGREGCSQRSHRSRPHRLGGIDGLRVLFRVVLEAREWHGAVLFFFLVVSSNNKGRR